LLAEGCRAAPLVFRQIRHRLIGCRSATLAGPRVADFRRTTRADKLQLAAADDQGPRRNSVISTSSGSPVSKRLPSRRCARDDAEVRGLGPGDRCREIREQIRRQLLRRLRASPRRRCRSARGSDSRPFGVERHERDVPAPSARGISAGRLFPVSTCWRAVFGSRARPVPSVVGRQHPAGRCCRFISMAGALDREFRCGIDCVKTSRAAVLRFLDDEAEIGDQDQPRVPRQRERPSSRSCSSSGSSSEFRAGRGSSARGGRTAPCCDGRFSSWRYCPERRCCRRTASPASRGYSRVRG